MDEVTAGLLGASFQLSRVDSDTFLLQGEQLSADASRPLLGKPTPCVGREQELALLDFSFNACCEEPTARAVLVTAPAGVGKSRLRHEFVRRVERRPQPPLVLLGRGDPMESGVASYGLLGQALRRLCGITGAEGLEARRTRLYQRVALHLPEDEAQEVVAFLGELCAIPFPDEHSPRLRAARGDPRLDELRFMGWALVAFLKAECAHQPVLWVLEDLHWSDALTVQLMEEVLRELSEQPVMVLALARPEVKERFANLWSRHVQEVPLHGLSRKAGTRLVREVLGTVVPEALVQRAVEQSDGNALFLEELIRRIAEGRGESVPETILAVLQSRLMRMEPEARQVLLAASIFGRDFWSGGVRELLGWKGTPEALETRLRWLEAQEIIGKQPSSRFSGTEEYRFRHALLRDAAHGLVPPGYRVLAHPLAAAWLERMGEADALALAMHYQLGEQLAPAVRWYTQAAEQLFERNDYQGMMRCVEHALECGASGEPLARLRALQAMVAFWREEMPRVRELGEPALSHLKAGSVLWCRLVGTLIASTSEEGLLERMAELNALLMGTQPEEAARSDYLEAITKIWTTDNRFGNRPRLDAQFARILEVGVTAAFHDIRARAWIETAQTLFFHYYEAKPWQAFMRAELAARDLREVSPGSMLGMQIHAGATLVALGDVPGALTRLEEMCEFARRVKQPVLLMYAGQLLMQALADSSEPAHWREAHTMALARVGTLEPRTYWFALAHGMAARTALLLGNLEQAESLGRKACALLWPFRSEWPPAQAVLSTVLLRRGHVPEARSVAELGVREVEAMRSEGVYAVGMYLALAEACFALGDPGAGEEVLGQGLRCVHARAEDIPEPAARERFLRQVPENARTRELARQRWGEAGPTAPRAP